MNCSGGNAMDNGVIVKIKDKYPKMSKGQKAIADFILQNYEKASFLTAAKLGKEVGTSESTVVRFAMSLGYSGFPVFQEELQELVKKKLNTVEKMEAVYGNSSRSEILTSILQSDMERIRLTLKTIDAIAFDTAIDAILKAKNIYIIGIRSCAPLAEFLAFYFNILFDNVRLIHTNSSSEILEQMLRIDNKDVIIGISFPRYSVRTLKAMEFANNRNAKVITITDSIHSPMNLYSSCNLIARSDMASILDSLVAPLSVMNALVVALCMKKQKEVVSTLETLEDIWGDYQSYSNDEINVMEDEVRVTFPEN